MSSNLNNRVHHISPAEDPRCSAKVYFNDIESVVCDAIREACEVVVCVAWLKSTRVVNELSRTPSTVVLTSDRVHRANRAALNALPSRQGLRPASVVGLARGRFRPLMHNKFLVLIDGTGAPYSVLTGSYNYTQHSTKNLENIVRIDSDEIANAYFDEALELYKVSRQL